MSQAAEIRIEFFAMTDPRSKLEELLEGLSKAEAEFCYAKAALSDFPRNIAREIPDPGERRKLARNLYWFVPQVPAADIAEYLLGCRVHEIPREIGWLETDVNCDRCGTQLIVRSREELREARSSANSKRTLPWAVAYRVLCAPCKEVVVRELYPNLFEDSE
jgi:hypothetical protein